MKKELSKEEIDDFVAAYGKRAHVTMNFLMNNVDVMKSYESPIGQEILKHLVSEHEELFEKITALKANDEEKIRFKVIRDIIFRLSKMVNNYYSRIEGIKNDVAKLKGV